MRLTGWRYGVFIGTYVGIIGIASYFIIISPIINPEPYLRIREEVAASQSRKKQKSTEETSKNVNA
ncbi:uncharacterized protein LOC108626443 [Ceratina calcarata]|uniref:Uncharacterized protein LOC108626443 n=1 Tax=Ceratina calcarata TaxID=156304 RepID=A0AAJ7N8T1_9HYME|nr:uncharacterized protein LOC108626443 [Ceratina calcarata]